MIFVMCQEKSIPEKTNSGKLSRSHLHVKGIDCKNDGVAIKKSVLEDMARQAGININTTKRPLLGKRPGSSIEACRLVIAGKGALPTNPNARICINLAAEEDEFLEEESVPLNQVTGISSTSFVYFGFYGAFRGVQNLQEKIAQ